MSAFAFCPSCSCGGCEQARARWRQTAGRVVGLPNAEALLAEWRVALGALGDAYAAAWLCGDELLARDVAHELADAAREFRDPDAPSRVEVAIRRKVPQLGRKAAS